MPTPARELPAPERGAPVDGTTCRPPHCDARERQVASSYLKETLTFARYATMAPFSRVMSSFETSATRRSRSDDPARSTAAAAARSQDSELVPTSSTTLYTLSAMTCSSSSGAASTVVDGSWPVKGHSDGCWYDPSVSSCDGAAVTPRVLRHRRIAARAVHVPAARGRRRRRPVRHVAPCDAGTTEGDTRERRPRPRRPRPRTATGVA